MADERIEQREPPASLVALRIEVAKPHNIEIFNYASAGLNFEDCLARIGEKLGILLDGIYDVPELCDVLVAALKRRSVLKVIGENGFTNSDHSEIDQRLLGIRRIEDANTVRLENRSLILPEGVRNEQLAAAVNRATKELTDSSRVSDAEFVDAVSEGSKKSETSEG